MRICLFLFILLSGASFAQNKLPLASQPRDYNFGFENTAPGTPIPAGWRAFNRIRGYSIKADSIERHSGLKSLLHERVHITDTASDFASISQTFPAMFQGKEVELNAFLKLQDVSDFVSIIIRIDDAGGKSLAFATLQDKKIRGTSDWKKYSIKLKIPKFAEDIHIGTVLSGTGRLWVDDVQVLLGGKNITEAPIRSDYDPNAPKIYQYGNNPTVAKRVKFNGVNLYCETYGEGEPLLLLHGNSLSINSFAKQIPVLSKHFKVIAIDTRGQGNSWDYTSGPLKYETFADDMKALMDTLRIQKAHILGWSDGGNTGLIMAMKYPAYVDKLVLMGANLEPSEKAVKSSVLKELAKAIENLESKTDNYSTRQLRLFTLLSTEPNIKEEELKKIKSPVLVMAGQRDMILEEHTRAIASGIPNARLVILKGATHYAPVQKTKSFNKVVLGFLKRD